MGKRQLSKLVLMSASLAVLVPHSVAACGFGDSGLSRAQVEEITREEMTNVTATRQPEPGATTVDVEKAIRKAMADLSRSEPGLTRSEVEEIVKATLTGVPQPQAGIWVTHEDVNPATGEFEDKHFWLVEHDGLVFGSGWHHDESGG